MYLEDVINPLNAELNPICHLLALLAHHIFHVSRLSVNTCRPICRFRACDFGWIFRI